MQHVFNVNDLQMVNDNEAMVNGEKWAREPFNAWYKVEEVKKPVQEPIKGVVEAPVVEEVVEIPVIEEEVIPEPEVEEVKEPEVIEKVLEVVQEVKVEPKFTFGKKKKK